MNMSEPEKFAGVQLRGELRRDVVDLSALCERICGEGCDERCDPVPFCADTCDRAACPEGTRCELVDVQCVSEPCPPVRRCEQRPNPCAQVNCRPGTRCVVNQVGQPICTID